MTFQVKTTHYIRGTNSPHWESRTEFLVQDYTQVSLSFVIYSWNISKMADTDMLGLAMLSLSPVCNPSFSLFPRISMRCLSMVIQERKKKKKESHYECVVNFETHCTGYEVDRP
jgi:hypothetical protein